MNNSLNRSAAGQRANAGCKGGVVTRSRSRGGARFSGAAILVLTMAFSQPCGAWENQGHMATGEVAYDQLSKTDPGAVRTIMQMAGALPYRTLMDAALKGTTGPVRDRLTFAYLARWPDDIRKTPLDRPADHYRLRIVSDIGSILPLHFGNANVAYQLNLATLQNTHASARDRAIAVAWVMHIVGDIHQPLHAGTWLSWQFPLTDRGGTIAYVRPSARGEPMSLHKFWDRIPSRDGPDQAGADAIGSQIQKQFPRWRLPELRQHSGDFASWTEESAALARKVVYMDGAFEGSSNPQQGSVLPRAYAANAKFLSERLLALAGYRLADVLAQSLGQH